MNKQSIAFKFLQTAWLHRKYLVKTCGIGLVAGLLVALSIPKEYVSTILLSPESISGYIEDVNNDWTGNFVEGSKKRDAITPDFYPYIASSPSFLTALFDIPVQCVDCPSDSVLTLYEYIDRHQRLPWWGYLQTGIKKVMGLWDDSVGKKSDKTNSLQTVSEGGTGILALSIKDASIAAAINERISIEPDVKTRTVTLSCRMQDPVVAATVLDSLGRRIQAYITEYRTRKERAELATAQILQQQAREKYYQAQEIQAAFEDCNRNLATRNAQKELVKLRILTAQAYQEYTRTTLQVHAAETQVIRVRPVFAVIQPATTPVRPASPSKVKYMAAFALLGLLTGYARIGFFKIKKRK